MKNIVSVARVLNVKWKTLPSGMWPHLVWSKSTAVSGARCPHLQGIRDRNLYNLLPEYTWARIAQSVYRLATGWTVWGSNPGGGARFSAYVQTGPGAHPASYTMGTGSFPGVKRPGLDVDHPPHLGAKVKERVELYHYSPSGPWWPVLEWTLPFPLPEGTASDFRKRYSSLSPRSTVKLLFIWWTTSIYRYNCQPYESCRHANILVRICVTHLSCAYVFRGKFDASCWVFLKDMSFAIGF